MSERVRLAVGADLDTESLLESGNLTLSEVLDAANDAELEDVEIESGVPEEAEVSTLAEPEGEAEQIPHSEELEPLPEDRFETIRSSVGYSAELIAEVLSELSEMGSAKSSEFSAASASPVLSDLHTHGMVERDNIAGKGVSYLYFLTERGERWLKAYECEDEAACDIECACSIPDIDIQRASHDNLVTLLEAIEEADGPVPVAELDTQVEFTAQPPVSELYRNGHLDAEKMKTDMAPRKCLHFELTDGASAWLDQNR